MFSGVRLAVTAANDSATLAEKSPYGRDGPPPGPNRVTAPVNSFPATDNSNDPLSNETVEKLPESNNYVTSVERNLSDAVPSPLRAVSFMLFALESTRFATVKVS